VSVDQEYLAARQDESAHCAYTSRRTASDDPSMYFRCRDVVEMVRRSAIGLAFFQQHRAISVVAAHLSLAYWGHAVPARQPVIGLPIFAVALVMLGIDDGQMLAIRILRPQCLMPPRSRRRQPARHGQFSSTAICTREAPLILPSA